MRKLKVQPPQYLHLRVDDISLAEDIVNCGVDEVQEIDAADGRQPTNVVDYRLVKIKEAPPRSN
jgi:hypothetical protein